MGRSICLEHTMITLKNRFNTIKQQFSAIICILVLTLVLTSCTGNYLPENDTDIDSVFERDYSKLIDITDYLVSLEESIVYIDYNPLEIKGEFGTPMEFDSPEIIQIANELAEEGYYHIVKDNNVIVFDVWRKPIGTEFEAGFAYSIDGTGDLSEIQYLTKQCSLSKENWYYYEEDYNEWRVRKDLTSSC